MKSSFCIDLQRFMLIPTKFPLSQVFLQTAETQHITAFRKIFVRYCYSDIWKGEKYKPYILKYKALISKYVPCIFREKRHLIFNDLQNRKNSVFPHRCARKKIIRNGMYTSPQTVHRFRRADGFYTHAACVSKAPECRCKNTV